MAQSRTLKLSILADVDQLSRNLKSGSNDVETFGDKLTKWSKAAGAAFAAAGAAAAAYAGKLAIDSVKAAAVDEAAQRKLATTLENVTKATDAQIASVEEYISVTAMRTGIEDDQLRPAMARLVRSTEDATKAQQILNLALDVAAGTGKPLETVVNALGKAYDGNANALGRLGLGIDSAVLKTGDFDKITAALQLRFKGFAEQEANTFEGKMGRIKLAIDEAKESIGAQLLPVLEQFVTYIIDEVVPNVQKWIDENGPKLVNVMKEQVIPTITALVTALATIVSWIVDNAETLRSIGTILLAGLAAAKITSAITTIVTSLGTLVASYTAAGTAAAAAGTATATAAASATAAAATTGGWALLASRFSAFAAIIATVTVGLLEIKRLVENDPKVAQRWIDFFNNLLPGPDLPSVAERKLAATKATNSSVMDAYAYEQRMAASTKPPTTPPPTSGGGGGGGTSGGTKPASDKATAALQEAIDDSRISRISLQNTADKLNQVAAQQLVLMTEYDRASKPPQITFNAPVVSDPESLARLISDSLNSSATRTGNYTDLGLSPTSLTSAVI